MNENAKRVWDNNDKLLVRQIDEGKLLSIKAIRTLPIGLKNKDRKKTLEIKLGAKKKWNNKGMKNGYHKKPQNRKRV